MRTEDPEIPSARPGFRVPEHLLTQIVDESLKGYIVGVIHGADDAPFNEGLYPWPPELEPPFIPRLSDAFQNGYRAGFRDGRCSRN